MDPLAQPEDNPKTNGDITILLLGETGVGKSTWINGFANFIEFNSLDEAEEEPTLCLIPASFTITDDNYEERRIVTGNDKNEVTDAGQSATQHPQTYSFPKNGSTIRLIDTPGIGDVRGVEQDKKNFELILDHISHLSDLDAICILLKPNNARLNIMFSFCIKELLTHLHKDACRNIVFCFTNSRSTFYRPGDTLPALRKLLQENKDVEIALNQSTLYCMDNEAIRFLYAMKDGVQFSPEERDNYVASWEKSVSEISRLVKHASAQPPHSIKHTLSLNNARQTILALRHPMAEVTRNIQINIAAKEKQKLELESSEASKEELSKNLIIQEYDVRTNSLSEPRTICTAVKCIEFVGDRKDINYKTQCHQGCGTGKQKHFGIVNIVGHKKLRKCSAFDRNGFCKRCGCSWKHHMKIDHETIIETKDITDKFKENEIKNKDNAIIKIQNFLDALNGNLQELRMEQAEITLASVEFARFLRSNAITPYNDSMDAYLMHFINEEKNKVAQGAPDGVLLGMEQMRIDYNTQMEVLEGAMQDINCGTAVSPADLEKCVENLYRLKHSGNKLMEMMQKSMHCATSSYSEKVIERSDSFIKTTTVKSSRKKKEKKPSVLSKLICRFETDLLGSPDPMSSKKEKSRFGNIKRSSTFRLQRHEATRVNQNFREQNQEKLVSAVYSAPRPVLTVKTPNTQTTKTCVTNNKNTLKVGQAELIPEELPVQIRKTYRAPAPPIFEKCKPSKVGEPIPVASVEAETKTLPPIAPPPPPAQSAGELESKYPVISETRASLMEQIRQPGLMLRKIGSGQGYQPKKYSGDKCQPSSMEDALKKALKLRSLRVQDSMDEDDEWN